MIIYKPRHSALACSASLFLRFPLKIHSLRSFRDDLGFSLRNSYTTKSSRTHPLG